MGRRRATCCRGQKATGARPSLQRASSAVERQSSARAAAGRAPERRSAASPASAIIAPLSVHSSTGGKWTVLPDRCASASSRARNCAFAPTPPATTRRLRPVCLERALCFGRKHVNDRIHECPRDVGPPLLTQIVLLARGGQYRGLQAAEAEIKSGLRNHRARQPDARPRRRSRRVATPRVRPDSRARAACAVLSKASPAASSSVSPSSA